MWLTDMQKIGVGITSFGVLFLVLGVIMFFDAALLALGDILFLGGITCVIGPQKNLLFLCAEEQDQRDDMLPGRHRPRLLQVSLLWHDH